MAIHPEKHGPWALITGGSLGIGRGYAEAFAAAGLSLVLVARRQEALDRAAAELAADHGVQVRTLSADLTEQGAAQAVIEACEGLEIGTLINNAAYSVPGAFLDYRLSGVHKEIAINVSLVAHLSHHFGAQMKARGRGAIINVSSMTGELVMPYFALYCATKAVISHFTEALWFELKDHGVDVLAVKPDQTASEGYLAMNPGDWGEGIQSVEDCVRISLEALGEGPESIPWPASHDHLRHIRSLSLEDSIALSGEGMKQVFGTKLDD